ncbi:MAG: 50S ribosomal protein L23 [Thermoanaerobacteraceae bacterium]|uniref:50S ribosomal protein L23 n=1 Tax=Thermanaeromonas sp. C210 TaxID=2731925 RepID=UPI00155C7615|nr:50S ribosomal protein L23 [Thermanaeromonas sp. C210]MBE3580351.1 50S ribosomal protein L23 [Thermoanaerobacteraceae bacterium]GFN23045.1 50S ribosomal protein L23 [Thermanaeromonas sp. C210]
MRAPQDIVIAPLITEKTTNLMADNKYTFIVARDANKIEIKHAIEKLFNVKVLKVNTLPDRGKLRRMGRFQGRQPDRKKAIVTLAPGQKIPVFEGLE